MKRRGHTDRKMYGNGDGTFFHLSRESIPTILRCLIMYSLDGTLYLQTQPDFSNLNESDLCATLFQKKVKLISAMIICAPKPS